MRRSLDEHDVVTDGVTEFSLKALESRIETPALAAAHLHCACKCQSNDGAKCIELLHIRCLCNVYRAAAVKC
jgi:hypothetical protein